MEIKTLSTIYVRVSINYPIGKLSKKKKNCFFFSSAIDSVVNMHVQVPPFFNHL